jgi:hypothetical protein
MSVLRKPIGVMGTSLAKQTREIRQMFLPPLWGDYSSLEGALCSRPIFGLSRPTASGSARTAFVRFARKRVLSRIEYPIIKKPDRWPGFSIMASPRGLIRCLRQLTLRAASLRSAVCRGRETSFRSVRTEDIPRII